MSEILVVEDEPTVREIIVEILRRGGHACDTAADGVAGLARVMERHQPYDLIYTNWSMPRMSGPEFLDAIRPVAAFRVPRLLGSGSGLPELVNVGLRTGVCDVLAYPFDFATLRAKVEWSLRVQAAYRERATARARRERAALAGVSIRGERGDDGRGHRLPAPKVEIPGPALDETGFLFHLATTTSTDTDLFRQEHLFDAMGARDPDVARGVAKAIQDLGATGPPFPPGYLSLLTSPIPEVRVQVARTLTRVPGGLARALPVLRSAIGHRDPEVSRAAIAAVQELADIRH